jgi:hypothetical protein
MPKGLCVSSEASGEPFPAYIGARKLRRARPASLEVRHILFTTKSTKITKWLQDETPDASLASSTRFASFVRFVVNLFRLI